MRRAVVWGTVMAWVVVSDWIIVRHPSSLTQALLWDGIFLLTLIVSLAGTLSAARAYQHYRDDARDVQLIAFAYVRREAGRAGMSALLLLGGLGSVFPVLGPLLIPSFFGAALLILANSLLDWLDRVELARGPLGEGADGSQ